MKHSEYAATAQAYRLVLAAAGGLEHDQQLRLQMVAVCDTEGCVHAAQVVHAPENVDGVFRAFCGHCERPTRLAAIFDDTVVQLVDGRVPLPA